MDTDYLDLDKLYNFEKEDEDAGGDDWDRQDDDYDPDDETESFF